MSASDSWITQSQKAIEKFLESVGKQLEAMDITMQTRLDTVSAQIQACQTEIKAAGASNTRRWKCR
ncbi:MAG: hypothetical protein JXA21_01705 [Anaerolineae bacterium]|nr:hypothetical protein [Anaerolineae bacterium]